MQDINTGIKTESNFLNLKAIDNGEIKPDVSKLLIDNENIVSAFKTIRDQIIFTTHRIFVINVQGVTGKKVSYFSYPYSKIQYYGIETSGLLDIDSELIISFSNGQVLQFDFRTNVDIRKLNTAISKYIL